MVGQVEVASAGGLVGEQVAAGETKLLAHAGVEGLVEVLVGTVLDRPVLVLQEGEVGDLGGVIQVDEEGDLASFDGDEDEG